MTTKDPITCHVLDTLTGRPAPSMKVVLSCASESSSSFTYHAVTNTDGRIANWTVAGSEDSVRSALDTIGDSVWTLTFDTEGYYGQGKTFWPQVDLTFRVKAGEHYHVPLLLGPFSYTTYRGS